MEPYTVDRGSAHADPSMTEATALAHAWGHEGLTPGVHLTGIPIDEHRVFLSTLPAGRRERQCALVVVLVALVAFLAAVPFARVPLTPVWAFIPGYQSALVVNDLITAVVLFGQFRIVQSWALLLLASGYLFTAGIAVVHALTFPGLFAPSGLLGAGPQSTAWLYMCWHGGFPVFVIAYALCKKNEGEPHPLCVRAPVTVLTSVAAVLVVVGGCTLLATAGHDALPPIMQGHHYTPTMRSVVASVWILSLLALVVVWRRRPHTVLDLWLMVVLWAWLCDIALAAVLNHGRFDLGFYAGRIYGLLAASFVLGVLLLEHGTLYARLVTAYARERHAARMWLFSTAMESSADAILTQTLEGIMTSWNPAAAQLYGFTAAEVIGQPSDLIVPPDRREELQTMLAQVRRGERIAPCETIRVHKDGTRLDVSLTMSPITTPEGVILGASAIARDITAQKQLQEQLRHAQKMEAIGQLTGGLAHDFNNMLGVIVGNLDLLAEGVGEHAVAQKRIRTAQRAALRAADLTQRLLAFARRQPLNPAPTGVNALITDLLEMLPRTLGPDVQIATQLAADIPPAQIDPAGLENALLNLALNARDAMPGGGTLTFATQRVVLNAAYPPVQAGELRAGPYVWLAVSDTGQGMSREILDKVFEPFFTTKARDKGSGLGLAMVYGFVQQSSGHIRIDSELGHGTSVHLYVPVAAEAVPAGRDTIGAPLTAPGQGTVLVVDDEVDLLEIAVTYLEEMGFTVLSAVDGPSALEVVARTPALDLLLTDVIMPGGLNGVALAQQIRQQQPNVTVIYASGFASSALVERRQLQVDGPLVNKPYRKAQLLATVQQAFAHRHRSATETLPA
jgi:PAS domain S-box-containing protein